MFRHFRPQNPLQQSSSRSDIKKQFISINVAGTSVWDLGSISSYYINILKPTGYLMHLQFNIQKLFVLPTLYLCVLYLSENKQRLVLLTA